MEKELNIAAILKDKPKGTKLWSPISGGCKYEHLAHDSIDVWFQGLGVIMLSKKGKWIQYGETIIFPSKQMQDWSKFAWKKGDVLTDEKRYVIFRSFENDDYTEFFAPFEYVDDNTFRRDLGLITNEFRKVNDYVAQEIIGKVEEHYGGKLNLETLEIEQPKQEFKDGDIITIEDTEYKAIIIYKSNGDFMFRSYAVIDNAYKKLGIDKIVNALGRCTRLATDSEKQQLFSALAKEGKRWNPDTKTIEDLPKKYEFKPFDKVLVRDFDDKEWKADFFSHKRDDSYYCFSCVGNIWRHCIPYNDQTKHLLGTTDEWKGGEG